MNCDALETMELRMKSLKQRWAQYAYPQNKHLRGTSDAESKRIVRDATFDMAKLQEQINTHQRYCEVCQASASEARSPKL